MYTCMLAYCRGRSSVAQVSGQLKAYSVNSNVARLLLVQDTCAGLNRFARQHSRVYEVLGAREMRDSRLSMALSAEEADRGHSAQEQKKGVYGNPLSAHTSYPRHLHPRCILDTTAEDKKGMDYTPRSKCSCKCS